jgi:hypothetical protein
MNEVINCVLEYRWGTWYVYESTEQGKGAMLSSAPTMGDALREAASFYGNRVLIIPLQAVLS